MAQVAEQQSNQIVIEQTLARISSLPGVLGYIALHPADGRILEFVGFGDDAAAVEKYASALYAFSMLAQSTVRTIDTEEDLTFVRMRWANREVFIAPDSKKEYILIVVHEQTGTSRLSILTPDAPAPSEAV